MMVVMDMQPQDVGSGGANAFASRLNGSRNGDDSSRGISLPHDPESKARTAPVIAGHDRPRPDMSGHLSVKETQAFLLDHGLPRNERSIRRYCNNGTLTCVKIDTATGREWVVTKASLDVLVREQQQFAQQENALQAGPDTSGHDRTEPDLSGHLSEPDRSATAAANSELVEVLRESLTDARDQIKKKDQQIEKKDAQIAAMLERDHETNVLIQNLQGMVLQLQAPSADTSGHDRPRPGTYHPSSE